jgi:hypothetical protein
LTPIAFANAVWFVPAALIAAFSLSLKKNSLIYIPPLVAYFNQS